MTATSATALLPTRTPPQPDLPAPVAVARPVPAGPPRTSCGMVVHVGDSTSVGLTSPDFLPDARTRIDARYRAYGARRVITDIAGARSIVERWGDAATADETVRYLSRTRTVKRICWVFAMGTNDTANEHNHPNVPLGERIDRLLRPLRPGDSVLWVNVVSRLTSGHWAETEMRKWNDALALRCPARPNMHIFDWASEARPGWFQKDGIHYTSQGYAQRANRIARALARATPAKGPAPAGCVVGSA